MDHKTLVINGDNYKDIEGFYKEIDRVFTKDLTWKTGHNLDAFNDLLRGGFGVFEYYEPIKLVWKNSEKSRNDLGYSETVKHYFAMLSTCHPSNIDRVKGFLANAKEERDKTLFEIIIEIIEKHDHIELILE